MVADLRDLGLEIAPRGVDRTRPQLGQPEAVPLIEAQRIDVVVGRDEPQARAPGVAGDGRDGREEGRAGAVPWRDRVERQDLARIGAEDVGQEACRCSIWTAMSIG